MRGQGREDHLLELLHLDEEELVLLASGALEDAEASSHAASCGRCRERLEAATAALRVQPLHTQADPRRREALLRRLEAEGALSAPGGAQAWIELALDEAAIRVLRTNAEVRIQRAVATRSGEAAEAGSEGVAFFRRLGGVGVEVHLLRAAPGRFHLIVGMVEGEATAGWRVSLHRGARELASEPAPGGSATFKNLRPDAYRLVILDGSIPMGMVDVDVEGR